MIKVYYTPEWTSQWNLTPSPAFLVRFLTSALTPSPWVSSVPAPAPDPESERRQTLRITRLVLIGDIRHSVLISVKSSRLSSWDRSEQINKYLKNWSRIYVFGGVENFWKCTGCWQHHDDVERNISDRKVFSANVFLAVNMDNLRVW